MPETEVPAQEEVNFFFFLNVAMIKILFKIFQLAVYWLLRAAEQGESEAQETLVALAGEGRGVTEHNYVDLANLVKVAPNVAQGQFLGRTLFRTLSRGQVETNILQKFFLL